MRERIGKVFIRQSYDYSVVGTGFLVSKRVNLIITASWALRNNAPNSASAADPATNLRITQVMWILPFNRMS